MEIYSYLNQQYILHNGGGNMSDSTSVQVGVQLVGVHWLFRCFLKVVSLKENHIIMYMEATVYASNYHLLPWQQL